VIPRCIGLFLFAASALAAEPRIYLWAWDRPENLRFLSPEIGVAYFAGEIDLGSKKPAFRPRTKPLLLPEAHPTLPVLHVRAHRSHSYGIPQQRLILDAIRQLVANSRADSLQLDFEVYHSQREFYKQLVRTIKEENTHLKLSVTALASWCGRDSWLTGLGIAEIVPMLFDPSHKSSGAHHFLPQDSTCQDAVGIATYESYPTFPRSKKYFVFSNRAWRREDVTQMLARIHENIR
jgi:hypothetical protein